MESGIPPGSYFQYSPSGVHGSLQRSSSLTDRERPSRKAYVNNVSDRTEVTGIDADLRRSSMEVVTVVQLPLIFCDFFVNCI
ncbi:uncharacterized protein LOC111394369 isoform X2 [Olea europaea var. sylvestris]|uniref:uncharacterized protein LOC111394369 isoform X2 n=1 Tax=Olea europaea var. sylvestris TaxID=158386 RepID=UPI000C1D6A0C|nr:uncharacterized protein LOC111394369 isoform X2 [Olea europaea var. sylvestris]